MTDDFMKNIREITIFIKLSTIYIIENVYKYFYVCSFKESTSLSTNIFCSDLSLFIPTDLVSNSLQYWDLLKESIIVVIMKILFPTRKKCFPVSNILVIGCYFDIYILEETTIFSS